MTLNTDPQEELEVPHLKQRLWEELAELHAKQRGAPTTQDGSGDELVRWKARRSRRIAAIAAAAAAVLIVGVFTAQLVSTGEPASSDDLLVERVVAATDEALTESVVHAVDDKVAADGVKPTLRLETWHDETTGIARLLNRNAQGDPMWDVGPLTGPTLESPEYSGQRIVDYCTRGYIEHRDTGGADTSLGAGVVDLRELIAKGELVEDGTEVFDGRELIRLLGTDSEGSDFVLLVNPDTYRVEAQRGELSLGETYTTIYEYLPRTADSLDLLHPPIPDGFRPIDPSEEMAFPGSCDG